jgi:hypothetical protein
VGADQNPWRLGGVVDVVDDNPGEDREVEVHERVRDREAHSVEAVGADGEVALVEPDRDMGRQDLASEGVERRRVGIGADDVWVDVGLAHPDVAAVHAGEGGEAEGVGEAERVVGAASIPQPASAVGRRRVGEVKPGELLLGGRWTPHAGHGDEENGEDLEVSERARS